MDLNKLEAMQSEANIELPVVRHDSDIASDSGNFVLYDEGGATMQQGEYVIALLNAAPEMCALIRRQEAELAAARASLPAAGAVLTEKSLTEAVRKWFPDRNYQAPFFARAILAAQPAAAAPDAQAATETPYATCKCAHIGECDGSCAPYIAAAQPEAKAAPAKAEAPVYQVREIGEGDWHTTTRAEYERCQRAPEMDTRTLPSTTAPSPAMGEELPPLPDALDAIEDDYAFTADQMHAYGRACMALRQPGAAKKGQLSFDDWYTRISIEGDMRHNMRRAWDAAASAPEPSTLATISQDIAMRRELDRYYPAPDSLHTSVIERNRADRRAFSLGYHAATPAAPVSQPAAQEMVAAIRSVLERNKTATGYRIAVDALGSAPVPTGYGVLPELFDSTAQEIAAIFASAPNLSKLTRYKNVHSRVSGYRLAAHADGDWVKWGDLQKLYTAPAPLSAPAGSEQEGGAA